MCRTFFLLVLAAFILVSPTPVVGTVLAQGVPSFDAAGTNAAQAAAFLKTLQSAVSVGNCLKVASLVEFPLEAWANGRTITIRNESEFHARYSQVFSPELKKSIADARPDALLANQSGVMFGNGRLLFRPVVERKNALRIVAINEPGQAR
jgi:hypothetical protein